jgi:threonine dehydrogenase-like Zn-dependent dehydrogenase
MEADMIERTKDWMLLIGAGPVGLGMARALRAF